MAKATGASHTSTATSTPTTGVEGYPLRCACNFGSSLGSRFRLCDPGDGAEKQCEQEISEKEFRCGHPAESVGDAARREIIGVNDPESGEHCGSGRPGCSVGEFSFDQSDADGG